MSAGDAHRAGRHAVEVRIGRDAASPRVQQGRFRRQAAGVRHEVVNGDGRGVLLIVRVGQTELGQPLRNRIIDGERAGLG